MCRLANTPNHRHSLSINSSDSCNSTSATKQLGISLIEVLVSTVIIAIALLGMIRLQMTSLQANQHAYSISQASLLGYDILERISANKSVPSSQYFNLAASSENCEVYNTTDPKPNCSASQLATDDIFNWQRDIARLLPRGNGLVCRSDLQGDVPGTPHCEANDSSNPIVVYIWWHDKNENALTQLAISAES